MPKVAGKKFPYTAKGKAAAKKAAARPARNASRSSAQSRKPFVEAKASAKKAKEALGRLPICRYHETSRYAFGNKCPFSHDLPGAAAKAKPKKERQRQRQRER